MSPEMWYSVFVIVIISLVIYIVSFPIVRLYKKVMEALQKFLDDEDPRRL